MMPAFRAFLDDGSTVVVAAADPAEARKFARAETDLAIRKIKLDRETVDPAHRAPRLTRRELREKPMSLNAQIPAMAERILGKREATVTLDTSERGRLSQPGPVDSTERAVAKMADDMRDIEAARGSVEEADLLGKGWTRHAIAQFAADARDLANSARERAL